MGLYWTDTFFFKPGCEGIVLNDDGYGPSILDNRHIITGLYDKNEFIEKFGSLIKDIDITSESYIVEDYFDTYGGSSRTIIKFSGL